MSSTTEAPKDTSTFIPASQLPDYGTYSYGTMMVSIGSILETRFQAYHPEYLMLVDRTTQPPKIRIPTTCLARLQAVKEHRHAGPGYLGQGKMDVEKGLEGFFTSEKIFYFGVLTSTWTGARSTLVYTGDVMPGTSHIPGPSNDDVAALGLPSPMAGVQYFWMPRDWLQKEDIEKAMPLADREALKEMVSRGLGYELRRATKRAGM